MAAPIFDITDGVRRISFVGRGGAFCLQDWPPARPGIEEVRQSSAFTPGSRLALYKFANAIETLTIGAKDGSQDILIHDCQDLDRLLLQAIDYWTSDWPPLPVYIEARGSRETNTRYAVIKSWRPMAESCPYHQPFFTMFVEAAQTDLTLILEHGPWMSHPPGMSAALAIESEQDWNGVTYGFARYAILYYLDQAPYIANKHNWANISHIYYWSAGGGWSGNLLGAGLPHALLPAPPAAGDIIYFGCDTTIADSGPFDNLIFDLVPPSVAVVANWRYYNGAWPGAVLVNEVDDTAVVAGQPFGQTGICSLHFSPQEDWTTVAVGPGAVAGYWIRCVLTGGGGGTAPIQQNRNEFTCTWPFLDVDEADVGGDLPALARYVIGNWSAVTGVTGRRTTDLLIGIRSLSRDDSFTPYINLSDEQNITAVVYCSPGVNATMGTTEIAPSGRAVDYSVAGAVAMTREVSISLPTNVYAGAFRAYLRYCQVSGNSGDIRVRLGYGSADNSPTLWQSDTVLLSVSPTYGVADLGIIRLPEMGSPGHYYLNLLIQNWAAAARKCWFYDLILMPADEWLGHFSDSDYASTGTISYHSLANKRVTHVEISSVDGPRWPSRARVYQATGPDGFTLTWQVESAGEMVLQANADQRVWFFAYQRTSAGVVNAWPHMDHRVYATFVQRYMAGRGAR